jgi:hypothetical protein
LTPSDHTLDQLADRLDRLESLVSALVETSGTRPEYLPIADAARLSGRTVPQLQDFLSRVGRNPDAPHVRRQYGRVHRRDLLAAIEWKSEQKGATRGQRVREALRALR